MSDWTPARLGPDAPQPVRLAGDGVTLGALRWPGPGTPLVAIHGMSSNAMFYVGIAERLAGRYGVLSLDLRGRGDSDKPDTGYGLAQHANDVAAAMSDAGVDRAVVVGHSMGAAVVWALAQRHPERCAGVVLFDGGPHAFGDFFADEDLVREFLITSAPIEQRLETDVADSTAYRQYWRDVGVFSAGEWSPWVDAYADYDSETITGPDGPARRGRCRRDAVMVDAADMIANVASMAEASVDVPVLVIRATSGIVSGTTPLVSDGALERIAATTPKCSTLTVPDTNHYTVALAEPAASKVADRLAEFSAELL